MQSRNLMLRAKNQQGAALLVTLILMLILLVVGTTAVRTAFVEERMARNELDRTRAREAAETALRQAELWLDSLSALPHEQDCSDAGSGECKDISVLDDNETLNGVLTATASTIATNFKAMTVADWRLHGATWQVDDGEVGEQDYLPSGSIEPPRYIIREMKFIPDSLNRGHGKVPGRYLYEITAIGFGSRVEVQQVLQSTYIRRY